MKNRNNIAEFSGKVLGEPVFGHNIYKEDFYNFELEVPRLSGASDILQVTVSGKLLGEAAVSAGESICVQGQVRSYNKIIDGKSRLDIRIFALEIENCGCEEYTNDVVLEGFLCKAPVYRSTPFGREISDMLIAVNRSFGKSDYIPAIAWGRNARYISNAKVGQKLYVSGRLQSREYEKKQDDGTSEKRTAYEVSVSALEFLEKDEAE